MPWFNSQSWQPITTLDVGPASHQAWLAGARRRNQTRGIGAALLIVAGLVAYVWWHAPFGTASSSVRDTYLALQVAMATLFAFGFLALVWPSIRGWYSERLELCPDGIIVHPRSTRTGRPLQFAPNLWWSEVRFEDWSESGDQALAAVPVLFKRDLSTWGGVDRDGWEVIAHAARAAGFTVQEKRSGPVIVRSFCKQGS